MCFSFMLNVQPSFLGQPMQVFQAKLQLADTHTVQCHPVAQPRLSMWVGSRVVTVSRDVPGVAWHGMASPALASAAPWHCPPVPLMPTLFPLVSWCPSCPWQLNTTAGLICQPGPLHKDRAVCCSRWHHSTDDRW